MLSDRYMMINIIHSSIFGSLISIIRRNSWSDLSPLRCPAHALFSLQLYRYLSIDLICSKWDQPTYINQLFWIKLLIPKYLYIEIQLWLWVISHFIFLISQRNPSQNILMPPPKSHIGLREPPIVLVFQRLVWT